MTLSILYLCGGLVALFFGGEVLLRGALNLARHFKLPELLIGLTIVGFGTSMPELLVSLEAAFQDKADIALGNVVGSNIANVILIGGVAALIKPMQGWDRSVVRDGLVMIAASFVLLGAAWFGSISVVPGAVFLLLLAAYLVHAYFSQKDGALAKVHQEPDHTIAICLALLAAGFVGLFIGANYLIAGATDIARHFGVSEAVIGLTIVAVGTSLPELATSVIAAMRGKSDIAIGNIVGSNIFNILGILGITGIIAPIAIGPVFLSFDIPIMLAIAAGFTALLAFTKSIGRLSGVLAIGGYGYYCWMQFAG